MMTIVIVFLVLAAICFALPMIGAHTSGKNENKPTEDQAESRIKIFQSTKWH